MTVRASRPTVILAGSEVLVVSIRRDPHPLITGITNEPEQADQTDGCKEPVRHVVVLRQATLAVIAANDTPGASTVDPDKC